MGVIANFAEIAEEILNPSNDYISINFIIDRHAKISFGSKEFFYKELISALTKNENYIEILKQRYPKHIIRAPITGYILYWNMEAEPLGLHPILLIGNKEANVEETIELIEKDRYEIYRKQQNGEITETDPLIINGVAVYLANQYLRNGLKNVSMMCTKIEGEKVYKDEHVITLEDFNFTIAAKRMDSRFRKADSYCQEQLAKLIDASAKKPRKTSDNTNREEITAETFTPNSLFRKIHLDKYDRAIGILSQKLPIRLEKKHLEVKKPFIEKNGDQAIWHGSKNHLAGFISVCEERKWLQPNLTSPQYVKILNSLFSMEIKSRTAFNLMKDGALDQKYIAVFTDLLNDIE